MKYSGILLACAVVACCGCNERSSGDPRKSEPPAKVESPVKEADLTKVHLTEAAVQRLGIELAPVERKSITLTRTFGGTIMVPQGGSIRITAPLGGTLLSRDSRLPRPGTTVKKGQELIRLAPVFAGQREVLSPSERLSLAKAQADLAASKAEAEGQVAGSEVQLRAAQAQLERAQKLVQEGAGSEKAFDEAQAAASKAEADLQAARSRLAVLESIRLEMQPDSVVSLEIKAPIDGIISAVHVREGLEVPAGTPLIDVAATDPVWVRVPVYVGQRGQIAPDQGALVRPIGSPASAEMTAQQVDAAPAGNARAGTLDLFLELPNSDRTWRPQERVVVRIPLKQTSEVTVVPWSAVVHDVHGGAWVYVSGSPGTYIRQRVEVREVVDSNAILVRGPQPGTNVVSAGVAELFGTEFGAGK